MYIVKTYIKDIFENTCTVYKVYVHVLYILTTMTYTCTCTTSTSLVNAFNMTSEKCSYMYVALVVRQ